MATFYNVAIREQGTTPWTNYYGIDALFLVVSGLTDGLTYEWKVQQVREDSGVQTFSAFTAIQTFTAVAATDLDIDVTAVIEATSTPDLFLSVEDIPPVIELNGPAYVEHPKDTPYVDQAPTGTDNLDGDISGNIVTTGTVDTSTAGEYVLTYTLEDANKNQATPVERTVRVAPVVAATSFNVRYWKDGDAPTLVEGVTDLFLVLNGIDQISDYNWQVQGEADDVQSQWSEVQTFSTPSLPNVELLVPVATEATSTTTASIQVESDLDIVVPFATEQSKVTTVQFNTGENFNISLPSIVERSNTTAASIQFEPDLDIAVPVATEATSAPAASIESVLGEITPTSFRVELENLATGQVTTLQGVIGLNTVASSLPPFTPHRFRVQGLVNGGASTSDWSDWSNIFSTSAEPVSAQITPFGSFQIDYLFVALDFESTQNDLTDLFGTTNALDGIVTVNFNGTDIQAVNQDGVWRAIIDTPNGLEAWETPDELDYDYSILTEGTWQTTGYDGVLYAE